MFQEKFNSIGPRTGSACVCVGLCMYVDGHLLIVCFKKIGIRIYGKRNVCRDLLCKEKSMSQEGGEEEEGEGGAGREVKARHDCKSNFLEDERRVPKKNE